MTKTQKIVKYCAIGLAILLALSILGSILGAIGFFGGLLTGEEIVGETKTYSVSSEIRALSMDLKAANLTIQTGDAFLLESNLKNLKVEESNGKLSLIDQTKNGISFGNDLRNAVLTLTIPEGTTFESVRLSAGAGKVTIDTLSADLLSFSLGAGDVSVKSLNAAKSAEIDGGAGRITIAQGALHNLDLDMGMGQLNLTSLLTGNNEINAGVGEMNLTVLGNRNDYKLDLEKGIGEFSLDGKSISELEDKNGLHSLSIEGGVGAAHLNFKAE